MNAARIAELLRPFLGAPGESSILSDLQLQTISTYIDLLLRWNARVNLTAVRDPEEIVTRHFGESLFAARCLFPDRFEAAGGLTDFGSGAGFPGLPIKIWAPHIQLTLIESNQKKATFLREVTRALTLTDVDVYPGRAEAFPGKAGVVTLRAVERFETALPLAAGLLAPAGRLALLIGQPQVQTARGLLPGVTWHDPLPIPQSARRVLVVATRS